ncbi:LysM peptidoglycan-binding domain-containing protein [Gardnerella vaginalis]|nr:LysM peptidoglycan-binding domain-containing protein [Gardnerella vaginalis]
MYKNLNSSNGISYSTLNRAALANKDYKKRKNKSFIRFIVFVALVCFAWIIFTPKPAVSAVSKSFVTYTVRPGDTLWSYAKTITNKDSNISDSVDYLMQINNLDSADLEVGQSIRVPFIDD